MTVAVLPLGRVPTRPALPDLGASIAFAGMPCGRVASGSRAEAFAPALFALQAAGLPLAPPRAAL